MVLSAVKSAPARVRSARAGAFIESCVACSARFAPSLRRCALPTGRSASRSRRGARRCAHCARRPVRPCAEADRAASLSRHAAASAETRHRELIGAHEILVVSRDILVAMRGCGTAPLKGLRLLPGYRAHQHGCDRGRSCHRIVWSAPLLERAGGSSAQLNPRQRRRTIACSRRVSV